MDARTRSTLTALTVAAGIGGGELTRTGRRVEARRRQLLAADELVNTRLPHQQPEALPLGEIVDRVGKRRGWSRFLGGLVRAHDARVVLELGASVGLSTAWLAAGTVGRPDAAVHAIEGVPEIAAIARETLAGLGLDDRTTVHVGRFTDVLDDVLATIPPVDVAFLDGDHEGRPTLDYLERIRPHLAPGAIVVLDDIRWSPGMRAAWRAIRDRGDTGFTLDLVRLGLWGPT